MTDELAAWEPLYGFCAYNETDKVALAKTLEAVRRQICAYGGGNTCDCKYGLSVKESVPTFEDRQGFNIGGTIGGSEQTGCPELREIINRLLHRDLQ